MKRQGEKFVQRENFPRQKQSIKCFRFFGHTQVSRLNSPTQVNTTFTTRLTLQLTGLQSRAEILFCISGGFFSRFIAEQGRIIIRYVYVFLVFWDFFSGICSSFQAQGSPGYFFKMRSSTGHTDPSCTPVDSPDGLSYSTNQKKTHRVKTYNQILQLIY